MKRFLVTTVDNPYHPVDEVEKWSQFDHQHGYNTNERIAKIQQESLNLTDAENQRIVNGVIDDFLRINRELGIWKKIEIDE